MVQNSYPTTNYLYPWDDNAKLGYFCVKKSQIRWTQEVQKFEEVEFSLPVGEIRSARTLQFSASVEVRPGNVSLRVHGSSREPSWIS